MKSYLNVQKALDGGPSEADNGGSTGIAQMANVRGLAVVTVPDA